MKKFFMGCGWLVIILMAIACQSENEAIVRGKVENGRGKTIRLIEIDTDNRKEIGEKKLGLLGRFKFSTEIKYPKFYELHIDNSSSASIILKPGQDISMNINNNEVPGKIEIEGSPETQDLINLEKELKQTRKAIDSLYQLIIADTSLYISLIDEVEKVQKNHRRNMLGYIIEHPSSMVSLATLYQQYDSTTYVFNKMSDLQFFKMVSDSLSKKYPRSKHVNALVANTENLLQNYRNRRLAQIMEGRETTGRLPDIALPNTKGDTLRFSSLEGKYVLLSFWSANHQDCIKYNLALQPVYNKYKNQGFEIYQVSIDTSHAQWTKALRFDEIKWYSVQDGNDYYFSRLYNVQQLPYSLLIDPTQTDVLAKNINPQKLDAKLNELLN